MARRPARGPAGLRRTLTVALLGLAVGPGATIADAGTTTFTPAADAEVRKGRASTTNYGSLARLTVDGSPAIRSYLRFDVQGLSGRVVGATLRLHAATTAPGGLGLHGVADNSWGESTITYANAPAFGPEVSRSTSLQAGQRASVDATPLVQGNGVRSFALTGPSNVTQRVFSRETLQKPELVVETSASPIAATGSASDVGPTGATLNGTVDPAGQETTYRFRYGTTDAYGSQTPASSAGSGTGEQAVSSAITGLAPRTTYHYRLVATNAAGTVTGADRTFTTAAAPGSPVVIGAAGDIACDPLSTSFNAGLGTASACRQRYTSDLLLANDLDAVLTLGDNQYEDGSLAKYNASYDPSWGRVKSLTSPVPGNHEYATTGAAGYFDYFNGVGSASGPAGDRGKGYYSYDVGSWHLIALNSNCVEVGGCGAGSPQEQWLRADLASSPSSCVLAYWHHPRFSSGPHGSDAAVQPLWQALYDAGADVVLAGHDHLYERFAKQTPAGAADPAHGIREFVVGTGGKSLYTPETPIPNSQVASGNTYGVLLLTLKEAGYDWSFLSEGGGTFSDSGSDTCSTDTPPPPPPPPTDRIVLSPIDDASIYQDYPTTKGGSYQHLTADGDPRHEALLKFSVSGIGDATVQSAKLRLRNTNESLSGGSLHRVADNSWEEETVTWNTAPAADASPIASLGRVVIGTWYELDVSPVVTGDGTYSFRLDSSSADGAYYSSRDGADPPQLVIELGP